MRAFLRSRGGGFTLLEVLLAFTIFAIALAVVLQIIASSTRATVRAKADTEMALMAQSVMETVGIDVPLESGVWSGSALDEYDWVLEISDLDPSVLADAPQLAELIGTRFYRIDLDIRWDNGRYVREEHFSTIRSVLEQP